MNSPQPPHDPRGHPAGPQGQPIPQATTEIPIQNQAPQPGWQPQPGAPQQPGWQPQSSIPPHAAGGGYQAIRPSSPPQPQPHGQIPPGYVPAGYAPAPSKSSPVGLVMGGVALLGALGLVVAGQTSDALDGTPLEFLSATGDKNSSSVLDTDGEETDKDADSQKSLADETAVEMQEETPSQRVQAPAPVPAAPAPAPVSTYVPRAVPAGSYPSGADYSGWTHARAARCNAGDPAYIIGATGYAEFSICKSDVTQRYYYRGWSNGKGLEVADPDVNGNNATVYYGNTTFYISPSALTIYENGSVLSDQPMGVLWSR